MTGVRKNKRAVCRVEISVDRSDELIVFDRIPEQIIDLGKRYMRCITDLHARSQRSAQKRH